MKKITYLGIGHKLAFKKYSLIAYKIVNNEEIVIITPISKKVYDILKLKGLPEEY